MFGMTNNNLFARISVLASKKNSSKKNNSRSGPSDYDTHMERVVQTLTMRAMAAGNEGDFETAFLTMELALWLTHTLGKNCLEAVLLNNQGLLYTLSGSWDRAMVSFDRAMTLAVESCPAHDNFLAVLKKNIACLFDPKIAPPRDPDA